MPKVPLAEQSWFVEFLAAKGFHRTSPGTFSNGQASIQVDGASLLADPGTGDKTWKSNLADADPETVKLILRQILKMRPFLTEADLAQERDEKQRLERALNGIAATIKGGPDTDGGVQLRRFLWALYNQHHLVNLWRMTAVLDSKRAGWVSEVFAGAFVGTLQEDDIKRALLAAGEMDRWDRVRPDTEVLEKLDEAERIVSALVRRTPPSHAHTELVSLLSRFAAAQREIRSGSQEP